MLLLIFALVSFSVAEYCEAPRACVPVSLDFCEEGIIPNSFCFEHAFLSLNEQGLKRGVDNVAKRIWNGASDDKSSWQAVQGVVSKALAGTGKHIDADSGCEVFYKAIYCNSFVTKFPTTSGEPFGICNRAGETGLKPCFATCLEAHEKCGLDQLSAMALCEKLSTGEDATVSPPHKACFFVNLSLAVNPPAVEPPTTGTRPSPPTTGEPPSRHTSGGPVAGTSSPSPGGDPSSVPAASSSASPNDRAPAPPAPHAGRFLVFFLLGCAALVGVAYGSKIYKRRVASATPGHAMTHPPSTAPPPPAASAPPPPAATSAGATSAGAPPPATHAPVSDQLSSTVDGIALALEVDDPTARLL